MSFSEVSEIFICQVALTDNSASIVTLITIHKSSGRKLVSEQS